MGLMPFFGLESRRAVSGFVISVALAWVFARWLVGYSVFAPVGVTWALLAAFTGWCVLSWIDYFKDWRPYPRKSDVIIFALALFPSAYFAKYVVHLATSGTDPLRYREIALGLPFAVVAAFSCQWLGGWWTLHRSEKRGILLVLLPEERAECLGELRAWRLHRRFEFLDYAGLADFRGRVHLAIISRRATRAFDIHSTVIKAHLAGIPVVDFRNFLGDMRKRVVAENTDVWSFLVSATPQTLLLRAYAKLKVLLEPPLALFGIVLLAPLGLLVTIAIKIDSEGPILYWQTRVGHRGKLFRLAKFRSMRTDAEATSPQWSQNGDTRVTSVGRILRKFRLDELPQLWNVVRGEMALVGPRPERPEFYEILRETIPLFSMRTLLRPGITGWAQVHAGYAASVEQSRRKLEFDLYYIQHLSLRLDTIIALKTLEVFLSGGTRVTTHRSLGNPADRLLGGVGMPSSSH